MFIADVEKALCDLVNLSQQVSTMVLIHCKCISTLCKVQALLWQVSILHVMYLTAALTLR